MLQWKDSVRETYYDILCIKEDASHEEIRTSYRSAILSYHPDKVQQNTSDPRSGSEETFLKVQKAWEVLGNPRSREIYDSELRASRDDTGVSEEVSLEDMVIEHDGQVLELFYQCRCGDYFSVDSLELADMGYKLLRREEDNEVCFEMATMTTTTTTDALPASVVLPCGSCSLQVRLLIGSEIKVPIGDRL
uniref:DPH4 homolog isoform X1 n=1 Tax=Rhizophora mucronata TaxID=61149 RepID=A0A2P2JGE8_RHIMU